MGDQENILCSDCMEQLSLIDPQTRCKRCFREKEGLEISACSFCAHEPNPIYKKAAAWDSQSAGMTLIKKHKASYTDLAGAFMTMQLSQLDWPMPDVIVPVPDRFSQVLDRGYDQNLLLAKQVSKLTKVPMKNALRRRLMTSVYNELPEEAFQLKKKGEVTEKTVLLIEEGTISSKTLKQSAFALLDDCPKSIYALTAVLTNSDR